MKCIIFVKRIVVARSLSYILGQIKILSAWKCDFLVGLHSGLKRMSRRTMTHILEEFRSGKVTFACLLLRVRVILVTGFSRSQQNGSVGEIILDMLRRLSPLP